MKSSMLLVVFIIFFLTFSSTSASNSNSPRAFVQCLIRSNSNSISKVIYTQENSTYTSVLQFSINNLRFNTPSTPKPIVIVKPVDESQIQTAIYCCKKHDIQMRIRSGGHDYEGLSYVAQVPFMVLDMINLRSIDVDPVKAIAWVQSGATLGELYYNIAQKSSTLGFPAGVWTTVGVGGLVSGGGYGVLRRKYGLACDNVLDARLIDANGRILDRKSMGEDLFWAIRGGGGSSFGVIVSWKLRLVYVPKVVTVFQVERTLEQNASDLFHLWQTVAPKLPKDIEIRVVVNTVWKNLPNAPQRTVQADDSAGTVQDDSAKTIRFRFIGLYLGSRDKAINLLSRRFPELGLVAQECFEVSYIQSVMLFSVLQATDPPAVLLNRTAYKIPFKAKSGFVDKPIPKQGLDGLWKVFLQQQPERTQFILTSYGGRMDEISESATPFPHRAGTLYMVYMRVLTDGDTESEIKWINGLYKYLTPYVTSSPRTSYLNYNDLDLGVNNQKGSTSYKQASKWGRSYFKGNFDRLVIIKSIVDPHNFFRHEQSIPTFSS